MSVDVDRVTGMTPARTGKGLQCLAIERAYWDDPRAYGEGLGAGRSVLA